MCGSAVFSFDSNESGYRHKATNLLRTELHIVTKGVDRKWGEHSTDLGEARCGLTRAPGITILPCYCDCLLHDKSRDLHRTWCVHMHLFLPLPLAMVLVCVCVCMRVRRACSQRFTHSSHNLWKLEAVQQGLVRGWGTRSTARKGDEKSSGRTGGMRPSLPLHHPKKIPSSPCRLHTQLWVKQCATQC